MRHYDVAVVGGGAMGASTAYRLAGRGASVCLLEQFAAGHEQGSSHGPSRIFRLAYPQRRFVPLVRAALPAWRALEDDAQTSLLTTTGGIDHGDPGTVTEVEEALREARLPCERIGPAEAAQRWRGLRVDRAALFQRDAGVLAADAAVRALHRLAAERGADLRFGERVVELRENSAEVEVATNAGSLSAGVVVLAAGAWLAKLAAGLELDLPPLRVTQEQPAYFATDEQWPTVIHHIGGGERPPYALPTPGAGMKVGIHAAGIDVDPDERVPPDESRLAELVRYVAEWLPGADPTPTRVDTCLYTIAPDDDFIIRRSGRVVVCSACSGHGFKFVPVIGGLVSDLALQQ